ncbi:MAG TPA: serine protease [Thermoanaerobaculia bacterium]
MLAIRVAALLIVFVFPTVTISNITFKDVARFNNISDVHKIEAELSNRAFNADPTTTRKGFKRPNDPRFAEYSTKALAMIHRQTTVYGWPNYAVMANTPASVQKLIESTAAVFHKSQLENVPNTDNLRIKDARSLEERGVCKDSLTFNDRSSITTEPGAAICTGFLIEPDVLITASHCVPDAIVRRLRFVFGYHELNGKVKTVFPGRSVLSGTVIDRHDANVGAEWARIKLERAPGAPQLTPRLGEIRVSEPVSVIGCPAGTGVKFADGANVRKVLKNTFIANLDVFEGHSGGPVLDANHKVIGFVARGERDWVPAEDCRQPYKCPDEGCTGETITRITALPPFLNVSR